MCSKHNYSSLIYYYHRESNKDTPIFVSESSLDSLLYKEKNGSVIKKQPNELIKDVNLQVY